jgi:hypothetical protein
VVEVALKTYFADGDMCFLCGSEWTLEFHCHDLRL